ncbi:MAG TPA: hypothetical protein VEY70_10550 [Metabacillus sp.]|nr:hypothetical protein [Metabacillus sp.]
MSPVLTIIALVTFIEIILTYEGDREIGLGKGNSSFLQKAICKKETCL